MNDPEKQRLQLEIEQACRKRIQETKLHETIANTIATTVENAVAKAVAEVIVTAFEEHEKTLN